VKKKKPTPKDATRSLQPDLAIFHRQRSTRYEPDRLESIVALALPACLTASLARRGTLHRLSRVEISVVGLRRMAAIHREFLGIFGATDVITFPYGEIFVCASVAHARAAEFGNSPTKELATYMIHGLLHLSGHDDLDPEDANEMAAAQEHIVTAACHRFAATSS